eukprot:5345022-Pleurochrysis_carterae.AAC.2
MHAAPWARAMSRAQVFGYVALWKRECCMARDVTVNWEGLGGQGRPRAGLLLPACSALVHLLFTACSPLVQRLFSACSPLVHCLSTARSPLVHRSFTARSPL